MIRHSSSFFFSLIFHTALFILLFFAWQNIPSVKKVDCEEKYCMKLCNVINEKKPVKPIVKPTPKPKPKKIKQEKPKPKPVVKKVTIVKEEPVVVPEVEEEIVEEVQEEVIQKSEEVLEPIEQVAATEVVEQDRVEDKDTKTKRLEQDYLQEHIAKIAELLRENLYYPRRARKRGIVGEVNVKFTLSRDGEVHSIEIISSNSEILSRAAIRTIENSSGEFPKPSEELTLHVPINYELKR